MRGKKQRIFLRTEIIAYPDRINTALNQIDGNLDLKSGTGCKQRLQLFRTRRHVEHQFFHAHQLLG